MTEHPGHRPTVDEQEAEARAASDATWPSRGYDGPPPWELAAQHLAEHDEHRELVTGELPQPYRGPGAVTHNKPLMTQGTAGPDVVELARRLAMLGYTSNSITRGQNHANVFDNTVWGDVVQFQRDHGVRENEASFSGGTVPAQDLVHRHVGPYTWQALIELSDQAERERDEAWAT